MADVIISPNMNLPVPIVGQDPGPDWANNINACLSQVDGHSHTPGSGVPITPSAININSDLTIQNHNLTNVLSLRFQSQNTTLSGVSDIGCIYEVNGDLYYNDGLGNQIRITQSGSVAGASGTITGLPSGTASAAYVSGQGTFVFQQLTNTGANMDIGSLILRYPGSYPTPSGSYISLQAPATLAAGFAFTLPNSLPASSNALLASNTNGDLSYVNADGSTITVTAGVISVPNGGITAAKLNSGAAASGAVATADGLGGVSYVFNSWTQVNYLIGGASGNFTVPTGVSLLLVELCGGGGGGNNANGSTAGGGGAGSFPVFKAVSVTAGQVIAYSVGSGGSAGLPATSGTNSTFGTLISKGGQAGGTSGGIAVAGCASGGGANTAGQSNVIASGGSGGTLNTYNGGGGGGAGAGNGGNGGTYGGAAATSAAANSGAGGGGAAGFGVGGNGGSGYIKIYYKV